MDLNNSVSSQLNVSISSASNTAITVEAEPLSHSPTYESVALCTHTKETVDRGVGNGKVSYYDEEDDVAVELLYRSQQDIAERILKDLSEAITDLQDHGHKVDSPLQGLSGSPPPYSYYSDTFHC